MPELVKKFGNEKLVAGSSCVFERREPVPEGCHGRCANWYRQQAPPMQLGPWHGCEKDHLSVAASYRMGYLWLPACADLRRLRPRSPPPDAIGCSREGAWPSWREAFRGWERERLPAGSLSLRERKDAVVLQVASSNLGTRYVAACRSCPKMKLNGLKGYLGAGRLQVVYQQPMDAHGQAGVHVQRDAV